jgi:hypothetical protein
MEVEILGVMIPIIAIIGIIIAIIYVRKFENEERLAMIEKGVSPEFLNIKRERNTSLPLRLSLLMIGAGVGLLFAYFLDRTFDMEEVAYFSMLFIFGGLGLGAAYLVEEKQKKSGS